MSVQVAVFLGIGLLFALAAVRKIFLKGKPITPRQVAGLWLSGLILLLIGRASPALAKGLTLLMVLAVVFTQGIPGIAVLQKKGSTPTPRPAGPLPPLGIAPVGPVQP